MQPAPRRGERSRLGCILHGSAPSARLIPDGGTSFESQNVTPVQVIKNEILQTIAARYCLILLVSIERMSESFATAAGRIERFELETLTDDFTGLRSIMVTWRVHECRRF